LHQQDSSGNTTQAKSRSNSHMTINFISLDLTTQMETVSFLSLAHSYFTNWISDLHVSCAFVDGKKAFR